jgi:hypothetical protein
VLFYYLTLKKFANFDILAIIKKTGGIFNYGKKYVIVILNANACSEGVVNLSDYNDATMKEIYKSVEKPSDDKIIDLISVIEEDFEDGHNTKYEVIEGNMLYDLKWYLIKFLEYCPLMEVRPPIDWTNVNVFCHVAALNGIMTQKEKEKLLKHFQYITNKKRERVAN